MSEFSITPTLVKVRVWTYTLLTPEFPEITWEMGTMEQHAFNGEFGPPEEIPYSSLQGKCSWEHLEADKVWRMVRLANVLVERPDWKTGGRTKRKYRLIDIPLICILLKKDPSDSVAYSFPADGNHRMAAREVLGLPTFEAFRVPPSQEGNYRIFKIELG